MSQGKLAASTTVSYHQQDLTKTNNHQAPLPTTQTYQNSNHHPKTTTINRLISAEPTTITKKQQQHAALLRTFNDSLKSDPHTNLASLSAQPITLLPFNFSENGVATAQSQQMVDSANIITLVPLSLPGGVAPAILSHTEAFVQQETVVTTSNEEEEEEEVSVNEVIVKNEAVVNSPAETVQESRSEEKLAREVEVKGPVMQKQKLFAGDVTRCICEMVHDDGFMICCDKCL